jgi:hypothetical protein
VLGRVAAQERDRDIAVQAGEQPDRAGEAALQFRGQLVDQTHAGLDQLLAGPRQGAQHLGGGAVLGQRGESVPVGAQHVGEQVGIPGIGLGAGAGVATAQALDLAWGDNEDRQVGVQQRLDQRAVTAFDRHTVDAHFGQSLDQTGECLTGVGDLEACPDLAAAIDDADGVSLTGPVDASEKLPGSGWCSHRFVPSCDDGVRTVGVGTPGRMLIAWRSNPHIPSAGLGVPARRLPQISCRSSRDKHRRRSAADRRFTGNHHRHPIETSADTQADTRMVHQ